MALIWTLLKMVIGLITRQGDNATVVAVEKLRGEVENYKTQVSGAKDRLSHPVAWVPEFLAAMSAVGYLGAKVVDAIWQLPGDIAPLDAPTAAVLSTIFASMFFRPRA